MSADPVFLTNFFTTLFGESVFIFGAYRAIRIGRALVSPVFRKRAFWTAILMISGAISSTTIFFPTTTVFLFNFLLTLPFFVILFVILAFVDSTIAATMELDFFHRDTLHWSKFRILQYVILVAGIIIAVPGFIFFSNSVYWQTVSTLGLLVCTSIVLAYSVVTLIISARRTYDKTMKRFVKLLGASLGCFAVGLVISFVSFTSLPFVLVSDAFTNIISIVILYMAVMSLSPISRKEMEATA